MFCLLFLYSNTSSFHILRVQFYHFDVEYYAITHINKYQNSACEDWASAGLILRSRLWRESRVGGPRWVLKTESADLIHFAAAIRVRLTFQRVSWILRKRGVDLTISTHSHTAAFSHVTFHWTLMPVLVQFKFRASAQSSLFFSIALLSLSLRVYLCGMRFLREGAAGRPSSVTSEVKCDSRGGVHAGG
jgi:hypothetical protein